MTDSIHPTMQSTTRPGKGVAMPNTQAGRALGLAIASLFFALTVPIPVWGLFMLFLAAPLGIAGLVYGHSALTFSRATESGRRKALTALGLAYTSLAICFFTTLFWVITMAWPR